MRTETREALELFVEKADRLDSLSFAESAAEVGFSWTLVNGETEEFKTTGPDSEQIDAFVLTLRFFMQDNDHISFRWLANSVLDDPGLSNNWKEEFRKARQKLNDYLDQLPPIQIVVASASAPTRREILDTFVYGDLSHTNPKRRTTLKQWMSRPSSLGLVKVVFVDTLRTMQDVIWHVAQRSRSELAK